MKFLQKIFAKKTVATETVEQVERVVSETIEIEDIDSPTVNTETVEQVASETIEIENIDSSMVDTETVEQVEQVASETIEIEDIDSPTVNTETVEQVASETIEIENIDSSVESTDKQTVSITFELHRQFNDTVDNMLENLRCSDIESFAVDLKDLCEIDENLGQTIETLQEKATPSIKSILMETREQLIKIARQEVPDIKQSIDEGYSRFVTAREELLEDAWTNQEELEHQAFFVMSLANALEDIRSGIQLLRSTKQTSVEQASEILRDYEHLKQQVRRRLEAREKLKEIDRIIRETLLPVIRNTSPELEELIKERVKSHLNYAMELAGMAEDDVDILNRLEDLGKEMAEVETIGEKVQGVFSRIQTELGLEIPIISFDCQSEDGNVIPIIDRFLEQDKYALPPAEKEEAPIQTAGDKYQEIRRELGKTNNAKKEILELLQKHQDFTDSVLFEIAQTFPEDSVFFQVVGQPNVNTESLRWILLERFPDYYLLKNKSYVEEMKKMENEAFFTKFAAHVGENLDNRMWQPAAFELFDHCMRTYLAASPISEEMFYTLTKYDEHDRYSNLIAVALANPSLPKSCFEKYQETKNPGYIDAMVNNQETPTSVLNNLIPNASSTCLEKILIHKNASEFTKNEVEKYKKNKHSSSSPAQK